MGEWKKYVERKCKWSICADFVVWRLNAVPITVGLLAQRDGSLPDMKEDEKGIKRGIDLLDQKSVHRCRLGCSTWPIIAFWIYHTGQFAGL